MATDIKTYGADERSRRWVQRWGWGGDKFLELVVIDELGQVEATGHARPFDNRAPTQEEAVKEILGGAIREADADLKRRGPEPEPKPEPPRWTQLPGAS